MNREELPRIRLKVATNAGINILCTALRTWRVVEWLPYIEEAYREVKEDQEGDEDSRKRFIKAIRIKKGNFYIANSELIGDIFEDNDEVQCQIAFPNTEKKKSKKQRKEGKKSKKEVERNGSVEEEEVVEKERERPEEEVEEERHEEKPRKKIKAATTEEPKQVQKSKPIKKSKKPAKPQESTVPLNKKEQQSLIKSQKSIQMKQKLMKNIDFRKLKSLINEANSSVKEEQSDSSLSS